MLLVEGEGDQRAVPELVRQVCHLNGLMDFYPASKPLKSRDIGSLERPGQLERFIQYAAMRPEGDSVLLVVDCDDHCAYEIAKTFGMRIGPLSDRFSKKIGIAFICREFESLFLFSIESIAERYQDFDMNLENFNAEENFEEIRNAKSRLKSLCRGKVYRQITDQVKFVTTLDWHVLRQRSRSFQHFEKTILWLAGRIDADSDHYPFL